jgi:hypothetical protein
MRSRCARVVTRRGSTVLILKGSMIVFMTVLRENVVSGRDPALRAAFVTARIARLG